MAFGLEVLCPEAILVIIRLIYEVVDILHTAWKNTIIRYMDYPKEKHDKKKNSLLPTLPRKLHQYVHEITRNGLYSIYFCNLCLIVFP